MRLCFKSRNSVMKSKKSVFKRRKSVYVDVSLSVSESKKKKKILNKRLKKVFLKVIKEYVVFNKVYFSVFSDMLTFCMSSGHLQCSVLFKKREKRYMFFF